MRGQFEDPIMLSCHDWLGNGIEVSHIFLDQDELESDDTQSPEEAQLQSQSERMDVCMVQEALYSEDGVAGPCPSPASDMHSVAPLSGDGVAGHCSSAKKLTTRPCITSREVAQDNIPSQRTSGGIGLHQSPPPGGDAGLRL